MTKDEFERLQQARYNPPVIDVGSFADKSDRTLVWGYTTERRDFHVYFKDGLIHRFMPAFSRTDTDSHVCATSFEVGMLYPNKRLYPEACDYEMMLKVYDAGGMPSFTTWDDSRPPARFYGPVFKAPPRRSGL